MRVKLLVGETDTLSLCDIQNMLSDRWFYALSGLTAFLLVCANPYHYLIPVSLKEWVFYFALQGPISVLIYVCLKFALFTVARTYNWRYVYEPAVTMFAVLMSMPFNKACADLAFRNYNFDIPEIFYAAVFNYLILEICITFFWHRFLSKRTLKYKLNPKAQQISDVLNRWISVGAHSIDVEDILWIRSEDHNIRISCNHEDDVVVRENLKSAVGQMTSQDGFLIHRSTWIARSAIVETFKEGGKQYVRTTDGQRHAVAKSREIELITWREETPKQATNKTDELPVAHFIGGTSIAITETEVVRLMMHPKTLLFWSITSFSTIFLNPSVLLSDLPFNIWLIFWASQSVFFFVFYSSALVSFNAIHRAFDAKDTKHFTTAIITAFLVHFGSIEFTNWITAPEGYSFRYSILFAMACALMLELFASLFMLKVYPYIEDNILDDSVEDNLGLEVKIQIETHSLALGDILHVKSDGHYLEVATKRARYHVKGTIAALEAQVESVFAVSPHRSYWIPRHAIKATQMVGGKLLLKLADGHAVNVARGRRDAVLYWIKFGRNIA